MSVYSLLLTRVCKFPITVLPFYELLIDTIYGHLHYVVSRS